MNDPIGILYLDDEEQNLLSFMALFRRDYNVFTAHTAQEAVEILQKEKIQIIFSDQKMPEVSGVEFFETILPDYPDAVRILITGYADIEAVIDAINKGQVYRYVTKPWDANDLRICVENAVEKFRRDRELIEKNEALERANAELEKFVYSASHDLRAPLVSIKGLVNVARLEGAEGKNAEYLNMIEQSTNKLGDFVDNIIHYYQNAQADELSEEVNFDLLIDELYEKFRHYENADKISLRRDINSTAVFRSDEPRIRMILANLISNAIRFSDPSKGEMFVEVQVVQNKEKAVIKVSDNGKGIPDTVLPGIFEMFYTASEKRIGSGIGLYIARKAAQRLGGKITVASENGKWTRFTLEIPNRA